MLRPWLDAGNVGTQSLTRLGKALGATEIGRLAKPGTFFDFTRYRPMTHTVEGRRVLTLPNSSIYFAKRPEPPDFLLVHLLEPHAFAEDYVESLVEVLKAFGVRRYCRVGGMYNAVPHSRPLRVTGTFRGEPLQGIPGITVSSRSGGYEGPTSIVNLVTDSTEKLGIETMSLMVHLPQYIELEDDYLGTAGLLEVLCALYDFPMELGNKEKGQKQYREVDGEVEKNPALKALVKRLETFYDSRPSLEAETIEEEEVQPLAPEIERFLQEMGKDFEDNR